MKNSILVVEDDPLVRESLIDVLELEGYETSFAQSGHEGLIKLAEKEFQAALVDIRLPGMTGIEFLREARVLFPKVHFIMMTSFPEAQTAVDAMKIGAVDYLAKPIDDDKLKSILVDVLKKPTETVEKPISTKINMNGNRFHNLVGDDSQMKKVYSVIQAINGTDVTVLLKGESGTGKGMIAQAIHYSDPKRKDGPYIEVSCGAIPRELLESELFGHVKGAFTSAIRDRIGRFELANGGTILLDEVDTLHPYLQVKLLRVIQQKVFEMVGDVKTKRVDVRIIASTNRDLEEEIRKGNFREDLYYRLKVITIEVPPLRDRKPDVLHLTRFFISAFNEKLKRNVKGISKEAMDALMAYDWPGNVRELENTLEWIMVLAESDIINVENLPPHLLKKDTPSIAFPAAVTVADSLLQTGRNLLKGSLKEPEKKMILQALEQSGWNRKKAAILLNISRTTLYNKIKEHQLVLD